VYLSIAGIAIAIGVVVLLLVICLCVTAVLLYAMWGAAVDERIKVLEAAPPLVKAWFGWFKRNNQADSASDRFREQSGATEPD